LAIALGLLGRLLAPRGGLARLVMALGGGGLLASAPRVGRLVLALGRAALVLVVGPLRLFAMEDVVGRADRRRRELDADREEEREEQFLHGGSVNRQVVASLAIGTEREDAQGNRCPDRSRCS
jgi:hypothetical protein